MQKKLIAVAVAGLMSSAAFAQSNVVISGSLDALFATFTNDKIGTNMDNSTHKTSRLNYKGTEDLGGGMRAFFELEERFRLDTATADGSLRFKDKAWLGLAGGFGSVSFGRVPTALDIIYGGGKIGNVDTIADVPGRKGESQGRVDNGISYTSPKLGPMTIYAHTAAKESGATPAAGTTQENPTPFGVAMNMTFGPAFVEAGWQKDGVTGQSAYYKTYILNAGLKLGSAANIYTAFSNSKGFETYDFGVAPSGVAPTNEVSTLAFGGDVAVGANGKIFVTLSRKITEAAPPATGDLSNDKKLTKLGVAYVHNMSKRTQLISAFSYERAGYMALNNSTGAYTSRDEGAKSIRNNRTGLQLGLRHAF